MKKIYSTIVFTILLSFTNLSYAKNLVKNNHDYLRDGIKYLENNELDKAETSLNKALDLEPSNDKIYYYLGNIYLKQFYKIKSPEIELNKVKLTLEKADRFFRESCNGGIGYNEACLESENINSIKKQFNIKVLTKEERVSIAKEIMLKNANFLEIQLNKQKEKLNIKDLNNISKQEMESLLSNSKTKKINIIDIEDYKILINNIKEAYKIDTNINNRINLMVFLSNYYNILKYNSKIDEAKSVKKEIEKLYNRDKSELINLSF